MPDQNISVGFDAVDNISAPVKKILQVTNDYERELAEMIAGERILAQHMAVVKHFEQMTEAEKETFIASKQLVEQTNTSTKAMTMSWTDFRSMYQTVLDVVRVGQKVWEETGQKYVDNAVLVGNLARAMGTTTEEASRLKEVADDVGIGVDSLRTSMKLALKDGFEPNIDGLARMSDEYLKLAPGTERMQYLLDRFGKSGEEMGKILEKGGESIRAMSAAMDEGLLVTEAAYKQAREYQIAVDSLSDSWDALTYKAAPPLVKAVTGVTDSYRDNLRAVELAKEAGMTWGAYIGSPFIQKFKAAAVAERELADAALLAKREAEDATGAYEGEAEATKRLAEEQKAAEQAIKDLTKANQDELATLGKMTQTIEAYKDKQTDLRDKHRELLLEKQKLINEGWWVESEKIQAVNQKLEENEKSQQENADAFQMATNQRILARAEELLSADGLTTAEKDGLIERGIAMGVYTEEAAARMREEEGAAASLAATLSSIPDNVSTTVTTYYVDSYSTVRNNSGKAGSYWDSEKYGHATGGLFEIPQSYGNEGFGMGGRDTASGGEGMALIPKGKDVIDYDRLAAAMPKFDYRAMAKANAAATVRALQQTGLL